MVSILAVCAAVFLSITLMPTIVGKVLMLLVVYGIFKNSGE